MGGPLTALIREGILFASIAGLTSLESVSLAFLLNSTLIPTLLQICHESLCPSVCLSFFCPSFVFLLSFSFLSAVSPCFDYAICLVKRQEIYIVSYSMSSVHLLIARGVEGTHTRYGMLKS